MKGRVTVMATAGHGGPGPDLYQLLGVARDASAEQVALAWRRRARAEHPDARPADADAAGRFRALAEAYRVLGDPVRRAAYDRALAREQQGAPPVGVTVRHVGPAGTGRHDAAAAGAGRPAAAGGPGPGGRPPPGLADAPAGTRRTWRRCGWRYWRSWRCGCWPPSGAGRGEPGLGGPGQGPVQHLGGRGAGRAAPADAAGLRAGGLLDPAPQRGRHPPVLPPRHRPAGRDLRADR